MEIYKDLSSPASKEFEKLLNSQLSKAKIEEGKIINGKINKVTEKFVFLFVEGLKSEPVLDINELKSMGLGEKIKLGENVNIKYFDQKGIKTNLFAIEKYFDEVLVEVQQTREEFMREINRPLSKN